jgi:hypothetical protein
MEAGLVPGAQGERMVVHQVAEGRGEQSFGAGGRGFIVFCEDRGSGSGVMGILQPNNTGGSGRDLGTALVSY